MFQRFRQFTPRSRKLWTCSSEPQGISLAFHSFLGWDAWVWAFVSRLCEVFWCYQICDGWTWTNPADIGTFHPRPDQFIEAIQTSAGTWGWRQKCHCSGLAAMVFLFWCFSIWHIESRWLSKRHQLCSCNEGRCWPCRSLLFVWFLLLLERRRQFGTLFKKNSRKVAFCLYTTVHQHFYVWLTG